MNIPLKQHLTIKNLSPTTGISWFARQMAVDAFGRCVGMLVCPQEEQEQQPDDEPMPIAVATLLQRVDELAAHHASLEEDIRQIERERKCHGRNRLLLFPGSWWPADQRGTRQEETHAMSA